MVSWRQLDESSVLRHNLCPRRALVVRTTLQSLALTVCRDCFCPVPSCFFCQRALPNLKILFSLHLPFHNHIGVEPLSKSVTRWVFLHGRNTRSNHSVSTLLAHPPPFTGLSLNNLSRTDSSSAWSVLGESNSLIISPLQPFITLNIGVCVRAFVCMCVKL